MKLLMVSLGCDKNLVDSEVMLTLLREKGYFFTEDESEAEVIVVNTCCFIQDAKEESIQTILEMAEWKKKGSCKALIVAGCLGQRYFEEMQKELPEVDAIIGTTAIDTIVETVEQVLAGKGENHLADIHAALMNHPNRVITTGGHYAYLKIAEGCDKHCTYCIIPSIRGNYRSVPMESLVEEAKQIAAGGVRELILVAQETTLYGQDLYGKKSLPTLLHKLCAIEELKWIRILYCYPEEITEEFIQAIQTEEKICRYLDMPIQHASDSILKRMGRRTDKAQLQHIIAELRKEIPDICLRTTLITGFPGETKENHEELMRFVDEMEFDRLGVFPYSPEEGTPAALMEGQIEEKVKQRRLSELMELQQEIAFEKAADMVGRVMEAMVEGKLAGEEAYLARTYKDAPQVDGYLFIHTDRQLMTGEFVTVKITGSHEYDIIGELQEKS